LEANSARFRAASALAGAASNYDAPAQAACYPERALILLIVHTHGVISFFRVS
jgi:hypothetical protein